MNNIITLLSVFLIVALISACDNDSETQELLRALTENDFAADQELRIDPNNRVLATFLENPGSDNQGNDTGEKGMDIIPVSYPVTTNQTFCWEDENEDSTHNMVLLDDQGVEILDLQVNGDCVTSEIEAGNYEIILTHDNLSELTHPVFFQPQEEETEVAKKQNNNHFIAKLLNNFSYFLEFPESSYAQTPLDNKTILLMTNACVNCNLSGVNLASVNLTSADLTGADLSGANLQNASLGGVKFNNANLKNANLQNSLPSFANFNNANADSANFSNATLNNADLSEAIFSNADLRMAELTSTVMEKTDLSNADLSGADCMSADMKEAVLSFAVMEGIVLLGADLTGADMSSADLTDATLSFMDSNQSGFQNAIITGATLTDATWCDRTEICKCADPSVGECVGCSDIEVCGPDSDIDLGSGNPTIKNLNVEIDEEDLEFLREAGLELNIAIKVNDTFNVVWYSDSDYLGTNPYAWSQEFELFGSNDFQPGSKVEMITNSVSVELGEEATLDSAGVLGAVIDGGPADSISFTNNFGPINPGLAMQITDPDGTEAILPAFVTPDPLLIMGSDVLTPVNEVMLWFAEIESGTMFAEIPTNSLMVDLTNMDEVTVLYSNEVWSIQDSQ